MFDCAELNETRVRLNLGVAGTNPADRRIQNTPSELHWACSVTATAELQYESVPANPGSRETTTSRSFAKSLAGVHEMLAEPQTCIFVTALLVEFVRRLALQP
jgi:hypothetical protein